MQTRYSVKYNLSFGWWHTEHMKREKKHLQQYYPILNANKFIIKIDMKNEENNMNKKIKKTVKRHCLIHSGNG